MNLSGKILIKYNNLNFVKLNMLLKKVFSFLFLYFFIFKKYI
jgi:hypothetical protein